MKRLRNVGVLLSAVAIGGVALGQAVDVDPKIPSYQKVSGVTGNLSSVGSDTMNNMATLWAEGFRKMYPSVNVQVEGKGSSTAPPALIEGTAQLGPMSRKMKKEEIDKFEAKYGYPPSGIRTALDGIAVYVNKDNPLNELTLEQVDAINNLAGVPSLGPLQVRDVAENADDGPPGSFGERPRPTSLQNGTVLFVGCRAAPAHPGALQRAEKRFRERGINCGHAEGLWEDRRNPFRGN